jgi:predicted transcriptional regulator of viral defense system
VTPFAAKNLNMGSNSTYNYIETYLSQVQSEGKYSFTFDELQKHFKIAPNAVKKGLQRLLVKGKIVRLRKEFYLIIPPEYSSKGMLPTLYYVSDLMKFLQRDYYIGLLSAAMIHGAGHQQPQDFYIIAGKPFLRDIKNKKAVIRFTGKKSWDKATVVEKKTDAGFVKVSSPELTALDIVCFQESIGGLNRVATVLDELAEKIDSDKLVKGAISYGQIATVQRLGYLMENILSYKDKIEPLYNWLETQTFYPVFLKPIKKKKGKQINNRWKVIKNFSPKSDL